MKENLTPKLSDESKIGEDEYKQEENYEEYSGEYIPYEEIEDNSSITAESVSVKRQYLGKYEYSIWKTISRQEKYFSSIYL